MQTWKTWHICWTISLGILCFQNWPKLGVHQTFMKNSQVKTEENKDFHKMINSPKKLFKSFFYPTRRRKNRQKNRFENTEYFNGDKIFSLAKSFSEPRRSRSNKKKSTGICNFTESIDIFRIFNILCERIHCCVV